MKKLVSAFVLCALCISFIPQFVSAQTKADTTATLILNTTSEAAVLAEQAINATHVDFGQATELKDSIAAVLKTASTDPAVAAIKDKTIELVELGQKAKNDKGYITPLILGSLALLGLLIGYLLSHFGVFKKKA